MLRFFLLIATCSISIIPLRGMDAGNIKINMSNVIMSQEGIELRFSISGVQSDETLILLTDSLLNDLHSIFWWGGVHQGRIVCYGVHDVGALMESGISVGPDNTEFSVHVKRGSFKAVLFGPDGVEDKSFEEVFSGVDIMCAGMVNVMFLTGEEMTESEIRVRVGSDKGAIVEVEASEATEGQGGEVDRGEVNTLPSEP